MVLGGEFKRVPEKENFVENKGMIRINRRGTEDSRKTIEREKKQISRQMRLID